jgi:hypothetical protein
MDYTKPVEIAENIFWVGYVIPNDPFQCHVYLIKNGDESILIDPGITKGVENENCNVECEFGTHPC